VKLYEDLNQERFSQNYNFYEVVLLKKHSTRLKKNGLFFTFKHQSKIAINKQVGFFKNIETF
jgi:hypothetical protein